MGLLFMRLQYRLQAAFSRHRGNKFGRGLGCPFRTAPSLPTPAAAAGNRTGKKKGTLLYRRVKRGLITVRPRFADAGNGRELPSRRVCLHVFAE